MQPAPMGHHRLRPGLASAWRGPGTLQIGLGERAGIVLSGVTEVDVSFLDLLASGVTAAAVTAGQVPPGPARCAQLLDLLDSADLLITEPPAGPSVAGLGARRARLEPDAAAWSLVDDEPGPDSDRRPIGDGWARLCRRAGRVVLVHGLGRTGWSLAALLSAVGVRTVVRDPRPVRPGDLGPCGPTEADLGLSRENAFARQFTGPRHGGTGVTEPHPDPDLVVLVDHTVADATTTRSLLQTDLPHLSVVLGEGRAVIGPLVTPGEGPCLRCLDLHRADRDPAWPHLVAQLSRAGAGSRDVVASAVPEEPEETVLAQATAALTMAQVQAFLDGRPAAAHAATLELGLPDLLPARRPWSPHPSCGCTGLRAAESVLLRV